MKNILTGLIILLSCITCFGQVDKTKVPFVAYWSKGDSYDFRVTKIKKQWKEGILTKNDSTSYTVNFLVIDSTETSYKINWSFKTNLTEFNIPKTLMDKFSKYQLTEVIYQTSEIGEFIGIENWKEVSEMMKGLFTDLVDVLSVDNNASKDELTRAMQPLINIYESKQGIELLVFKELQCFHFPFGLECSTTEPIVYEEQLPNMFGGKPIRGDAKIYIDTVDFENSYCILVQEMKLNPEDTKDIITTLFKQMNLKDNEMKKAMKTAQFDITDNNKFEYYYYPGVPIRIETNRESLVEIDKEKGKRIDITRIELIE